MQSLITGMPGWIPLMAAAVGLAGALAALLYARHTISLACDRMERAQDLEKRLLKVLGQHPEILSPRSVSEADSVREAQGSRVREGNASRARQTPLQPQLLAVDPRHGWQQKALTHISSGHFDEAEVICRQQVGEDPKDAQAHNTLGVVLRKTNRVEAAVASCRHATLLDPTCISAHINLGVALRNLGRPRQAEAAYRRAIELDPDNAVAHSSLGVALGKQGRHEEAESCYLRALEIDTRYTSAWLNLAIALEKRGALEEAQTAYRCALDLGTEDRESDREMPSEMAVA